MTKEKTAILLMNVGSPDRPDKKSVRRFLFQFLNDKRVIDLPWLFRKILVNLIIIPFRVRKSTLLYKRLFNEKGSPLIYYSEELKSKLQKYLGDKFVVSLAMRYGNPGYKKAIQKVKNAGFQKIVIAPLFPQYAMSTTQSAIAAVEKEIKCQRIQSEIIKVEQFYHHQKFIEAFKKQVEKYDLKEFDHIVFSYHGLPNKHIEKSHRGISVENCDCIQSTPDHGKFCYRATCFATSRKMAKAMGLSSLDYTNAFQSRLTKKWLSPFTDEVLLEKLKEGNKNILVIAPSFVTDCLETIIEIGEDYQKLFQENGGERLQLVESLNATDEWVSALGEILTETLKSN